jgi:hypothetical protein
VSQIDYDLKLVSNRNRYPWITVLKHNPLPSIAEIPLRLKASFCSEVITKPPNGPIRRLLARAATRINHGIIMAKAILVKVHNAIISKDLHPSRSGIYCGSLQSLISRRASGSFRLMADTWHGLLAAGSRQPVFECQPCQASFRR